MSENRVEGKAPEEECTDLHPCGKCALCLWSYEQYVSAAREREAEEGSCYDPEEVRGADFYKAYGL